MGEATSHQAWEDIPSWKRLVEETDAQSSMYMQMGYFVNTKKSLKHNKIKLQQFVRKQIQHDVPMVCPGINYVLYTACYHCN